MRKKCSGTGAEFEIRVNDRRTVKGRQTGIAAVVDTIAILNTDPAFDNFGSTVNGPSCKWTSGVSTRSLRNSVSVWVASRPI